jgi:mRNA deadenylase 3'-5' endonuclease subunit Ccr4
MWADRKLLRFKDPPEPVHYKETKSEKIERCRLKVLSYRVMAQSKATLTRFPTKSAGCLNWMHRRKNILEYASRPHSDTCAPCLPFRLLYDL